jgi:hypothetical protein
MSDDRSVPSRGRSFTPLRSIVVGLVVLVGAACVQVKPATDTSDPEVNPVGPSSREDGQSTPASTVPPAPPTGSGTPVAYVPDLQPVFASDCVRCHNNSSARAGYSMSSYQAVLRDVRAGDASSRLVTTTRPGGSMYRYFSGDRTAKSNLVYNWVVVYGALQQR